MRDGILYYTILHQTVILNNIASYYMTYVNTGAHVGIRTGNPTDGNLVLRTWVGAALEGARENDFNETDSLLCPVAAGIQKIQASRWNY